MSIANLFSNRLPDPQRCMKYYTAKHTDLLLGCIIQVKWQLYETQQPRGYYGREQRYR
jgi:hypothetical protein